MNKQNKAILIIIAALIVILAVFLALNWDNITAMQELQQRAEILFSYNAAGQAGESDSETYLAMPAITALKQEIKSMIQRSATFGYGRYEYTCVKLTDVLELAGAPLDNIDIVIITGADGYTSALKGKELMNNYAHLAFYRNGQPLGEKSTGGTGPFQLVVEEDVFAQRWVRYVSHIEVLYK